MDSLPTASSGSRPLTAEEAWLGPGRFAIFLLLLLAAAFPEAWSGTGTFYYRDFSIFGYPLAHHQRESFWRGELPGWNPYNDCGLPFLAQWNTLCLYPPALFYLMLPLSWALGVFGLAHLYAGGLGMYFLVRRWTGHPLAAAVAGVAFACNGLAWHALMWPNNIAALGWMPWVVGAAEQAWQTGGRRMVVAALAGGLQMLTGAPEIIGFTWLAVGAVGLAQFVEAGAPRAVWARRLGTLVALVALLAAVQLLPFLDLLAHSQRGAEFGDRTWAMPWWGWANFLVPRFHSFASFHGIYVQQGQYWTTTYYPGAGVVLLGVIAAWRVRERRAVALLALGLAGMILALGDAGGAWAVLRTLVPGAGFMRFAIKFVVLPMFVAPVLAGFAVRWLLEPAPEQGRRARTVLGVVLALAVVMGGIVWAGSAFPLKGDDVSALGPNTAVRAAFLAGVAAVLAGLLRTQIPHRRVIWGVALLVLLAADVWTHGPNPSPSVARAVYGEEAAGLEFEPRPAPGVSRAFVTPGALAGLQRQAAPSAADDVRLRRLALYGNCNLLDAVPKVNGFYSLVPREIDDLLSVLYFSTRADYPRLLDALSVSQASAPGRPFDWEARRSFVPMVSSGQRPDFADAPAILPALQSAAFDPHRVVYLPEAARAVITATNGAEAKVLASRFQSDWIELDVDVGAAAGPALLVLAQTYYHWWQAEVDGRSVPLWRANHALQALEVPAGRHRVRLEYRDRSVLLGAVLSAGTLLGLAWCYTRREGFRL